MSDGKKEFVRDVGTTEGQSVDVAQSGEVAVIDGSELSTTVASATDISGGVTSKLARSDASVYLSGTGGDTIKIELSPDGGSTWYAIDESPVSIGSDGDTTVALDYTATDVRFTNTTGTAATTVHLCER